VGGRAPRGAAVTARRERIDRTARIGQAAAHAATQIRDGGALRLPAALAVRVDEFLAAADRLAALAEDEVLALEGARDWGER
jgi:hypothetical protein